MTNKILLLFATSLFSLNSFSSVKLIIAPSTEYIAFYKKDINNYLTIRNAEGFRTDIELNNPDVSAAILKQMHFIETNINKNKSFINNGKEIICRIGFSIKENPKAEVVRVNALADNGTKICNSIEFYLKELSKKHSELEFVEVARTKNILEYDIFYIVR